MNYLSDYSKLNSLDNLGCHGLALPVLESYFHLREDFAKYFVYLIKDGILFSAKRKRTFVYSFEEEDLDIIKTLQKQSMIYSAVEIKGLDKRSNFYEIVYNLDKVFDSNSYSNKKKRYNRLIYPFKWIRNKGVEVKIPSYSEVEVLHKAWVDFKLNQPSTYRIMFPTA